jgi:hypothetical protein
MKLAYVHVLPLEYYPPARNALSLFAAKPGWTVRAWSTDNGRGLPEWRDARVAVRRPRHGDSMDSLLSRMSGYAAWHTRTAVELSRWKPDAIIAVEPHSMLAVWVYYSVMRGSAPLFIHHHEYYSPEDFLRPGMRLLRTARRVERDSLLDRAVWVSQTNEARLRMMIATHPRLRPETGRVLPNYPPAAWIERGRASESQDSSGRTRLVYLGSASFEDTFIREIATLVSERPDRFTLHVVGDNVSPDVWSWIAGLRATNITSDPAGCAYEDVPALLSQFDAGLVLYKGNTLNFVHNVPNKALEYLACGLEVWYPPEMEAMQLFAADNPGQRLKEVDFKTLGSNAMPRSERKVVDEFPFTCELALAPLVTELDALAGANA